MWRRHLSNEGLVNLLVLLLFALALVFVSSFHEPWFDEAQAWQIGKCASFFELLFEVPHYEGHPPLWHMLLAIPAKLGIPFEIGLKSVGFVFSVASAALLIFRSPFPLAVRRVLPFTYFFFYQYGVVVRPYCVMLFVMLLLACVFPKRNACPWRFVGLLVLLCLTSPYGMLIACAIALCHAWELVREKGPKRFLRELVFDQRTLSLVVLLVVGIALALQIMPRSDTLVTSRERLNSIPLCLVCALLTFLPESLVTTSSWFQTDTSLLQQAVIPIYELVLLSVVGVLLWCLVIAVSPKGKLKYIVVPYVLFAGFSAVVYFSGHHVGVTFILLVFWLWIAFEDENTFEIGRSWLDRVAQGERDRRLARIAAGGVFIVCALVSLYWSLASIVLDVQKSYSYGREVAAFIDDNDLENALLLSEWADLRSGGSFGPSDASGYGARAESLTTVVTAYFDHNIFYCFNGGNDNEAYFHYRLYSDQSLQNDRDEWVAAGAPDILFGRPDIEELFDGALTYKDDYSLVKVLEAGNIWKGHFDKARTPVYMRRDLLARYGLEEVDAIVASVFDGITLTDEMREQYESGVPMEEILKPYLDEKFGT